MWERYLADETGLDAREWHAHAERREHGTSDQQAEALAATLGYPRYDPHGDPIPTPSGEVPPHQGVPLTQLTPDQAAEIVHLEDEPDAVFAQIVAAGLVPGMRVRLLERTPQRLRIEADTEEVVLAPVVAANVTVLPIEQPAEASDDDAAVGDRRLVNRPRSWPWPRPAAAPSAAGCSISASCPAPASPTSCAGRRAIRRPTASAARSSPCGAIRRTTSSCTGAREAAV